MKTYASTREFYVASSTSISEIKAWNKILCIYPKYNGITIVTVKRLASETSKQLLTSNGLGIINWTGPQFKREKYVHDF